MSVNYRPDGSGKVWEFRLRSAKFRRKWFGDKHAKSRVVIVLLWSWDSWSVILEMLMCRIRGPWWWTEVDVGRRSNLKSNLHIKRSFYIWDGKGIYLDKVRFYHASEQQCWRTHDIDIAILFVCLSVCHAPVLHDFRAVPVGLATEIE